MAQPPNMAQGTGHVNPKAPNMAQGQGRVKVQAHTRARSAPRAPSAPRAQQPVDYSAPLSYGQIQGNARNAANLQYGGVEAQQALQAQQIPQWFQQYRAALQTPQQVAQTYQPAIASEQQMQQDTGKTLGLTGAAGEQDALAAKAREALIGMGIGQLTGAQTATTNYYQGRQDVANAAELGAKTQLAANRTQTAKDKAGFTNQQIQQGVNTERQYGLSVQHQNAENAAFNVKQTVAAAKLTSPNKYGVPADKWASWSSSHRERYVANFNKNTAKPSSPGSPKYGIDAATWQKMSTAERIAAKNAWNGGPKANGKDAYGNTPRQQQAANSAWSKVKGIAKGLTHPGDTADALHQVLLFKYGTYNADMLEAAAIHATGGRIPDKLRKSLAKQGVHLAPPGQGSTATVTRPPNTASANGQLRPT